MSAFSKILGLGDKALQDQADMLLLRLAKTMQVASARLFDCVTGWTERDMDRARTIEGEIVQLERQGDAIVDEIVESIFAKNAYPPQQTQERYELVKRIDDVIDAAERAAKLIGAIRSRSPPDGLKAIAEKCWNCTDLLQDAIKHILTDFKAAWDLSRRIEVIREETRDMHYSLLERLMNSSVDLSEALLAHRLGEQIIAVAIAAEEVSDFIRTLVVKYM
ncbi:MAG: DUF47 family protein [Candidatus Thorarchaeota archaeon]|nr:DUF47 family protein [Candidatus Thorarchaeota archaeon]